MDWTTPADIKKQLQRYWEQGRILRSQSSGPLFPLSLRLRKPDIHAVSERFDDVRKWIRCLEAESKAAQGLDMKLYGVRSIIVNLGATRFRRAFWCLLN